MTSTTPATPTTTGTAEVVLLTPTVDHTRLTVADLPRTPWQLTCGHCGETRARHWRSLRSGECRDFERPLLPVGYRYADRLDVGMLVRRPSQRTPATEVVVSVRTSHTPRTESMLVLQLRPVGPGPAGLAYLAPDVVVAVLEPDLPRIA